MHQDKKYHNYTVTIDPQHLNGARQTPSANDALKLTARWPARLIATSLVLTAAFAGWLVWSGMTDLTSTIPAAAPIALAVAVAILWIVTLSLLRRWRSADRAEYQRVVTRCEELTAAAERAFVARQDAITANRAKSEYLLRMGNEVRGPLTTILGFVSTLLDMGDLSKAPRDRVEALFAIKQKGEQLMDTIDDTLELCEIELKERNVKRYSCSLIDIVDHVHRLMAAWARARGLHLVVDFEGQVPESINTDPDHLSHILVNLLGNAVKFTLTGDVRMRIHLECEDHENPLLCFEVVDSGVGMQKEQADRLFGGFGSAASDEHSHPRTSGLGLTISKRYAEMLGGDIQLVDTLPGIGTRMRLTINVGSLEGVQMIQPPRLPSEAEPPSLSTPTQGPVETASADPVEVTEDKEAIDSELAVKSDAD